MLTQRYSRAWVHVMSDAMLPRMTRRIAKAEINGAPPASGAPSRDDLTARQALDQPDEGLRRLAQFLIRVHERLARENPQREIRAKEALAVDSESLPHDV